MRVPYVERLSVIRVYKYDLILASSMDRPIYGDITKFQDMTIGVNTRLPCPVLQCQE